MSINICNNIVANIGACCGNPSPRESATLLIKHVEEKFRVDWKHRQAEFEEAARGGELTLQRLDHTETINGIDYNTVLVMNGVRRYYFFTELQPIPPRPVKKKNG